MNSPSPKQDWKWQLRNQIRTLDKLADVFPLSTQEQQAIIDLDDRFRLGITPYYLDLMDPNDPNCPIRRQAIPLLAEKITMPQEQPDPLAEERDMPVIGVTRRYPNRALLYLTHTCAVYCRHFTRRRKVGDPVSNNKRDQIAMAIEWLKANPNINDLILSGGDPLFLKDRRLFNIIDELYRFVNIVRIHTRAVITSPDRVTNSFVERISKYKGLWLILHINHSNELCDEVCAKISGLKESGVSLLNQSVLLRGVNDDAKILACLSQRLLSLGVFPYYLHHPDNVTGNVSFRVSIDEGLKIYEQLSKSISGIALPRYVIDPPDGTGKIDVKDYWRNCGS